LEALLLAVDNQSCSGLADGFEVESISHDWFQRTLKDSKVSSLYKDLVNKLKMEGGYLLLDDTILEKHTLGLEGICKLLDTKTGGFILGLSVVLLCWSDGKKTIPLAFLPYQKGKSKHDLAVELLEQAKEWGLTPKYILFDAWYASQKVLKTLIRLGWHFVTRLRKNRYLDGKKLKTRYRHPNWHIIGKLKGGIEVKVFRRGSKFYATSHTTLEWKTVKKLYKMRAEIEEVFRILKQECGWQGVQQRNIQTYTNHLTFGLLAYLYLKKLKLQTRSGVFVLRRRLISGKLTLNRDDLFAFLDTAA
jgi:SRSO17 transposase